MRSVRQASGALSELTNLMPDTAERVGEDGIELASSSLYEWLVTNYQTSVTVMDQTLEPVLLSEDQAQHLETQPGTPAILSKVLAYSNESEPIEYSWSVTRGDQCRFYFSFRRGEE
jgi:DNA-binding GntR family transcriptional regulator